MEGHWRGSSEQALTSQRHHFEVPKTGDLIGPPWVRCSHWSNQVQPWGAAENDGCSLSPKVELDDQLPWRCSSDGVVPGHSTHASCSPLLDQSPGLNGNDALHQGHRSFHSGPCLKGRREWLGHVVPVPRLAPLGLPPPPSQQCPNVPGPQRQLSKSRCWKARSSERADSCWRILHWRAPCLSSEWVTGGGLWFMFPSKCGGRREMGRSWLAKCKRWRSGRVCASPPIYLSLLNRSPHPHKTLSLNGHFFTHCINLQPGHRRSVSLLLKVTLLPGSGS